MKKESRKRILILDSMNMMKNNATGITERAIFSNLEGFELLEIYRFNSLDCVNNDMPFQSIQIPPSVIPLNSLIRKLSGAGNIMEQSDNVGLVFDKNKVSLKRTVILYIKSILELSPIYSKHSFFKTIDSFRPQYIYTMGGNFYIQKFALYLANRYNAHIIVHYMDDWRTTYFTESKVFAPLRKLFQKQLTNLEEKMIYGLTISAAMAKEYESKYHHKYLPLMNVIEPNVKKRVPHDFINIVYAGGLHLNRYKTLLEIEKQIANIKGIKLNVYTSRNNRIAYEELFDANITEFHDAVSHDIIYSVYEVADILLHIESFDDKAINYTKYSLSTKIPEYMSSGRPILCVAPSVTAVYNYINDSKAGISISDTNKVHDSISYIMDEKNYMKFVEEGLRTVQENHSQKAMMKTFNLACEE